MFNFGKDSLGGEKFWNSQKIMLVVAILIGIVIGSLFQHYVIEPALQKTFEKRYIDCVQEKNILNEETNQCILEKQNCEDSLKEFIGS